jgi:hypothetical protein
MDAGEIVLRQSGTMGAPISRFMKGSFRFHSSPRPTIGCHGVDAAARNGAARPLRRSIWRLTAGDTIHFAAYEARLIRRQKHKQRGDLNGLGGPPE